jgi:hypothetical protein
MFLPLDLFGVVLSFFQYDFRAVVLTRVNRRWAAGHRNHTDDLCIRNNESAEVFLRRWQGFQARRVDTRGSYFTDYALRALGDMSALTALDLSDCALITDEGLLSLAGLRKLRYFNLCGCYYVTDDGLAVLANFPALDRLNLDHCYLLTDYGLSHLSNSLGLESLSLRCCDQITDHGLRAVLPLLRLRTLKLSSCYLVTQPPTARAHLETLQVDGCRGVTDAALAVIAAEFRNLTSLDVSWCNTSGAGLAVLARLPHLTHLDCSGCRHFAEGLRNVAKVTSLRSLAVRSTSVSRELLLLRALPLLRVLDLKYCWQVNDFDLARLAAGTNLTELDVSYCYRVSGVGLSFFPPHTTLRTEGCCAV